MNLQTALLQLEKHIQEVPEQFRQLPAESILKKPAPDKWSKQEILGHLIDSAINNLKRFIDAQYPPNPYKVLPYQQDYAVEINKYQQLPLAHLLNLWTALNQQILYVLRDVLESKLTYPSVITFVIIPSGEVHSLEWLAIDYVEHMEHHLKQVFA
jgi:hypothetical protein